MKLTICLFFYLFAVSTFAEEPSGAQIYIKMGEAQTKKSLLALPAFQYLGNPALTPAHQSIGTELFRVLQNDLSVSNYFQFIQQSAFLEDPSKTGLQPQPGDPKGFKFESWNQIGAEFLIRGAFTVAGQELIFETYLYHVPKTNLILGKKYRSSLANVRKIAHTFANDILEALTGKRGMFLSRVVVASDKVGGQIKEIYVMDWDGADTQKITNHKSISLSPAWSPDGKKIAYTAFVQRTRTKTRNADMFIYELQSGKRWLVSYRQGLNSGAHFSPDGQHLYLTLTQQGTPDIYKLNTDGNLVAKLTNGPRGAMNVEPAISPDGKQIAFSSDRSGQPMVYIMNADGTNPRRVTFAGKYNSTPAWSPDGKKLAFAGWESDHFDIFTMNADGTDMLRITSAKKANGKWAMNEDPVFSPDGRHLMYTSNRSGPNQIYVSNLDGSDERRVTNDSANYFKPKWSANLE
jgi:TolB protein